MSKKSNFMWDSAGLNLPKVEAHTKARHSVTEDYLRDWIVTLCGNNMGSSKKVTIIDGFCGGGMYIDENNNRYHGSPFRIIKSVEEGLRIVKEEKSKPNYNLDAEFIFIDSRKEHIQCLKKLMREEPPDLYKENPDKFTFICDEFENKSEHIIAELEVSKHSSMFILDPTGYTDVSMRTIRNIISLKKSEILYTFMVEYISRFIGNKPSSNAHSKILEAEGYFEKLDLDNLKSQSQQGYVRNETLRLFRNKGEVKYVYTFALIPGLNQVQYYLVHLASNAPAQRVIKHSLWKFNNINMHMQFRYDVYGLGFRSPDYFDNNCNLFDIKEENIRASIENLSDSLLPIITTHSEGIHYGELHDSTMQYNPATDKHYEEFINEQRNYGELEVIRNGKPTKAKNLKAKDLILRPNQQQLFILKQFQK